MDTIIILLAAGAMIFGIFSEVEGRGRNWAGWGVICLAAIHLLAAIT